MFHILSTPGVATNSELSYGKPAFDPGFSVVGSGEYFKAGSNNSGSVSVTSPTHSSSARSSSGSSYHHPEHEQHKATTSNNNSSNKKRSRRRRKGKSRSKVEPLSSYGKKGSSNNSPCSTTSSSSSKKHHDAPMTKRDLYFALDCEMVGVGQDGLTSAVGRVTIVNWENQVVLDTYVKVPTPVTDYRTYVSGITPEHLQARPGHALMTFSEVREQVQSILRGKILIGHGLENDLKALGLYHPWTDIRDTATYTYYMREFRDPVTQGISFVPKKLRDLAWEKLGRQIQNPGVPHCPMEDAIAALDLYKEVRGQWEDHLIRVAQQKDKEQQRQLMERRQQQEQQQQQQQQQQQMRRFQWMGAPPPPPPQPMYPGPQQQQPQQQPVMMHPAYRYPASPAGAPMMMMPPHSSAAAAFLQGPTTTTPPMPRGSSSWFGFSRRPKHPARPAAIPSTMSHDSIATQNTMTTVQSSFSQDQGFPRGAWHIREELAEETIAENMATEASHEAILEEPPEIPPTMETAEDFHHKLATDDIQTSTSFTESVTEVSDQSTDQLPTDYEPPRYFTNPDPEPLSSSSWFKLWGSRSSSKAQPPSTNDSDDEPDDPQPKTRRSSDTESSYSLFSGRLFPRRNSESCMTDLANKEVDEHSKSLH